MNRRKVNFLISAFGCRCPRCREGKMFYASPLNLRSFGKMHKECPRCRQDFRVEPGFYFGAAYFSYAFNVLVIIASLAVFFLVEPDFNEWLFVGVVAVLNIIIIPFNFRVSRSLMLHFFGSIQYDPDSIPEDGPPRHPLDVFLENQRQAGEE